MYLNDLYLTRAARKLLELATVIVALVWLAYTAGTGVLIWLGIKWLLANT